MRAITLNLNGIRSACAKGVWPWLTSQGADFICLQEVRAKLADLPADCLPFEGLGPDGYYHFFQPAEKPGYSGVGLLSRHAPDDVRRGMGWPEFDAEGRYLAADFGPLTVISLYLPSGTSGDERQAFKMQTLDRVAAHLLDLRAKGRTILFLSDVNIAHKEIDIKNWQGNLKNSGFLPEERAWLDKLFGELSFRDAFRAVNSEAEQYTWWSNRGGAYARNVGWRIDYHITTEDLKPTAATIYKGQKFSDHAPLTIDYDYQLRGR